MRVKGLQISIVLVQRLKALLQGKMITLPLLKLVDTPLQPKEGTNISHHAYMHTNCIFQVPGEICSERTVTPSQPEIRDNNDPRSRQEPASRTPSNSEMGQKVSIKIIRKLTWVASEGVTGNDGMPSRDRNWNPPWTM